MSHSQLERKDSTPKSRDVNWRSEFHTIQETHRHLLATGKLSDITFVIGSERQTINAHKFILMSRSPVFETMFERWNPENSTVEVTDTTFQAFKIFLSVSYIRKHFVLIKVWFRAANKHLFFSNLSRSVSVHRRVQCGCEGCRLSALFGSQVQCPRSGWSLFGTNENWNQLGQCNWHLPSC